MRKRSCIPHGQRRFAMHIRDHGWMILCALGVLATYAVTLSVLPRDVFWMPDPGAKYLELAAVRWAGGVRYDVPFPSRRIDPHFAFLPLPGIFPHPSFADDGSMRLQFEAPVLFPLISRVPYAWFGITGLYLLPLLSGWCCAIVTGGMMRRLYPRWAPFTVLLVGLATPLWFYSVNFWEHTVACLLALLAVYIAIASPRPRLAAALGMLVFVTAALSLRIEMLAFALALFSGWTTALLAARPRRAAVRPAPTIVAAPWIVNLLLVACVVGLLAVLDVSLTVRHRAFLAAAATRTAAGLSSFLGLPGSLAEVFVHSSVSEGAVLMPVFPALGLVAMAACCAAAFMKSPRVEAALLIPGCAVVLGLSLYLLCTVQPYRSLHGVFPIAPFLVVWPYALREAWRRRDHAMLTVTNVGLFGLLTGFAAIAVWYVSNGRLTVGLEWGQRYLFVVYPLLTIAALAGLRIHQASDSERPAWLRRAFIFLVAAMMIV